jgi:hypothetical protein
VVVKVVVGFLTVIDQTLVALDELAALPYKDHAVMEEIQNFLAPPHFAWLIISSYMSSGILLANVMATRMILEALRPGRLRRIWFGL